MYASSLNRKIVKHINDIQFSKPKRKKTELDRVVFL